VDARQAEAVAQAFGGEAWQSGGQIWLVLLRRSDGRLVVISDEAVCEYENREAFDDGKPNLAVRLV